MRRGRGHSASQFPAGAGSRTRSRVCAEKPLPGGRGGGVAGTVEGRRQPRRWVENWAPSRRPTSLDPFLPASVLRSVCRLRRALCPEPPCLHLPGVGGLQGAEAKSFFWGNRTTREGLRDPEAKEVKDRPSREWGGTGVSIAPRAGACPPVSTCRCFLAASDMGSFMDDRPPVDPAGSKRLPLTRPNKEIKCYVTFWNEFGP